MKLPQGGSSAEQTNHSLHPDFGQIAFEAMEIATAYFSADLTLRISNAAWHSRVGGTTNIHQAGTLAREIFDVLTNNDLPNPIKSHTAQDILGLVRSCVRDYELPRNSGDPLLFTSTPVKAGGFVVTLRDPDRGRILEESALALLRDSIESLDLGMMVWDAGLILSLIHI